MTDFTDFSEFDQDDGTAPLLDAEFDAPSEGSIEEAAIKIDAILEAGTYDGDENIATENPDAIDDAHNRAHARAERREDAAAAAQDDPLFALEVDGEETEVSLSQLTEAFHQAGEAEKQIGGLTERRGEIDTAFKAASAEIDRLIPALQRQLIGDFADLQTPQDIQALAMTNPARFADMQARARSLQQAEGYADTLSQFHQGRFVESERTELAKLIPELEDPEGGDELRENIRAYGKEQGFDDARFSEAGATEIAILHKAMKYDQLQQGQVKAARRARNQTRARPVMKPGSSRRHDPKAGYRQAMAKLKKTGHVEDAARVIEMML